MKDEIRQCLCGKSHPWGIIRLSEDRVPLYGAKPLPDCDNFRPVVENLPAGVDGRELWAQTGDLDAQASLATRLVVQRIRSIGKGVGKYQQIQEQWPEFIGFVISQITDIRGTLVRDEAKFSHLVAHTDEIVEAMRDVVQLSERLKRQETILNHIMDVLMNKDHDDGEDEALRHFGLVEPDPFDPRRFTPSTPEEPILVESDNGHADDDESDDDQGDDESDEGGNE